MKWVGIQYQAQLTQMMELLNCLSYDLQIAEPVQCGTLGWFRKPEFRKWNRVG